MKAKTVTKNLSLLYSQIDLSKRERYVTLKPREIHTKKNMRPSTTVHTRVRAFLFFSELKQGHLTQTQGGGPPG